MSDFRLIAFIKKADDVSAEELQRFYEDELRSVFLMRYPSATRYIRRYLRPFPNPLTGEIADLPYDMLTEARYASRVAFEQAQSRLSDIEKTEDILKIRQRESRYIKSIDVAILHDVDG